MQTAWRIDNDQRCCCVPLGGENLTHSLLLRLPQKLTAAVSPNGVAVTLQTIVMRGEDEEQDRPARRPLMRLRATPADRSDSRAVPFIWASCGRPHCGQTWQQCKVAQPRGLMRRRCCCAKRVVVPWRSGGGQCLRPTEAESDRGAPSALPCVPTVQCWPCLLILQMSKGIVTNE
jgi:hypothetical protein